MIRNTIPFPFGINHLSELQGIRIGQICVCCAYCQDEGVGSFNITQNHLSNLDFDVGRLISYRNLFV